MPHLETFPTMRMTNRTSSVEIRHRGIPGQNNQPTLIFDTPQAFFEFVEDLDIMRAELRKQEGNT